MHYKLKEIDKNHSIGVLEIKKTNNSYEYQALINLREYEQLYYDLFQLKDTYKMQLKREGEVSHFQVKTIKRVLNVFQFNSVEKAVKCRGDDIEVYSYEGG